MPKLRHVLFLALAAPAIGLCLAGAAPAEVMYGRGGGAMRAWAGPHHGGPPGGGIPGGPGFGRQGRSFGELRHHNFGSPGMGPGAGGPQMFRGGPRGGDYGPRGGDRSGVRGGDRGIGQRMGHGGGPHGPQQHGAQRGGQQHGLQQHGLQQHGYQQRGPGGLGSFGRSQFRGPGQGFNGLARNGLPHHPFPGETGFTGVPPQGETRYISHEMVVHVGAEVSPQALEAAARRLGLQPIDTQNFSLTGGQLVHFRVSHGDVSDVIRTLESEKIGIAQPNYVYLPQEDVRTAAPPSKGDPAQYVIDKLHLYDAHTLASGENVSVAVIDSLIDDSHPDLTGSIAGRYDAVAASDKPDEHGTGMTGAIAAHQRLLGVAPHAHILAIHAFSPDAKHPQQATTQSIVAGIDWAIAKGARVINMSFAGPYDPLLQLALKKARDKGVVLVAAAGNMGPQSPPLYPAADENVIAVTAVDEKDKVLPQANQGPHVALAAPGVNVLEAAPQATYNFTTGTSVAAAHVSGAAALILERNPGIDPAALEDVLYATAQDLGAPGRDSQFGYGLVDPYRALVELDAKAVAKNSPERDAPETTASANPRQLTSAPPPPGAASLIAGAPAGPIGPATPKTAPKTAPKPGGASGATSAAASSAAAPAGKPAGGRASAPPPASSAGAIPPFAGEEAALIEKKRQACSQAAAHKHVEAGEMADYVNLCVSEARLACLRKAVAKKVRGDSERRDFLNRCLEGSMSAGQLSALHR